MQSHGRSSFARLLAPLALVSVAVVVAAMVLGSGVVDDESDTSGTTSNLPTATERSTTTGRPGKRTPKTYTIKANDTLSGIAAEHGTTVDRLLELNSELDPQGLVAGQKIKLRE
jgi:LysM repeat protein